MAGSWKASRHVERVEAGAGRFHFACARPEGYRDALSAELKESRASPGQARTVGVLEHLRFTSLVTEIEKLPVTKADATCGFLGSSEDLVVRSQGEVVVLGRLRAVALRRSEALGAGACVDEALLEGIDDAVLDKGKVAAFGEVGDVEVGGLVILLRAVTVVVLLDDVREGEMSEDLANDLTAGVVPLCEAIAEGTGGGVLRLAVDGNLVGVASCVGAGARGALFAEETYALTAVGESKEGIFMDFEIVAAGDHAVKGTCYAVALRKKAGGDFR